MGWARSDGRGVMGIVNEASTSLRRVTLATGAIEDVKVPVQGFLDGVTVGGSIVTHSFGAGRVFTLTTLSPTGKVEHEVKPAAEVWYTSGGPLAGGTLLLGMGQKYPHKPVLNEYGVDTVRAWQPAYLVDPTTGAVRKLADSVDSGCCFGANYTVTGIAELRGADVEVRSIDPSGTTHLVTSFPRSSYPHRMYYWGFLSGTRLAYWGNNDTAGRSIFVTTGPTGSSTRLPVVGDFSWSPGGRKLAVVLSDRRGKDRPTVRILDIAADGSVTRTGPTLDLGVDLKDAEIGGIEWLDDASAVLVQLGGESADCNSCLVRRPLDPARPPTRVVLDRARSGSHRNLPVPAFRVDQGGKSVLFTQMSRGGASIWTAEFVPLKK